MTTSTPKSNLTPAEKLAVRNTFILFAEYTTKDLAFIFDLSETCIRNFTANLTRGPGLENTRALRRLWAGEREARRLPAGDEAYFADHQAADDIFVKSLDRACGRLQTKKAA